MKAIYWIAIALGAVLGACTIYLGLLWLNLAIDAAFGL